REPLDPKHPVVELDATVEVGVVDASLDREAPLEDAGGALDLGDVDAEGGQIDRLDVDAHVELGFLREVADASLTSKVRAKPRSGPELDGHRGDPEGVAAQEEGLGDRRDG